MCLAPADEFGVEGARALGRVLLTNTILMNLKITSKLPCSSFVCASDWLCLLHVPDLV
jgi:hypothetical protein